MTAAIRIGIASLFALFFVSGCATESVFVQPSKPHGIIEFKVPDPGHNPVRLLEIEDQTVTGSNVRRTSFWIKPGTYTLRLAMARSGTQTVGRGSSRSDPGPSTVQITIEEGKRYRIAARVTGAQANQWEPVIWDVQDIGS